MGISAMIGVATAATIYTGNQAKKSQEEASNRAIEQARQAQEAQIAQARDEQAQAQRNMEAQQAAEAARLAEMQKQAAEASAASANAATGAQNIRTSELTPTVQLAASGEGPASSSKARARRAQFRPEYTSGVTI